MKRLAWVMAMLTVGGMALAQDDPEPAADGAATEGEAEAEAETEPAAPEPAPTVTYTLDPGRSFLAVTVFKDPNTIGAGLAHDHAIVASNFDGKVTWNVDDASVCDVSISFPVTALRVDPGNARSRVGIDPDDTVGDGGKGTITSNFLGKSQLDASSFPTIAFKSTSCSGTTGKVKVTGDMSIRGVAKTVTVTMDVSAVGTSFTAKGSFATTHGDFGFKPFSAGFGALKNQDKLAFVIDVAGSGG
ncbi:MAG: polyisoprenoid-binding protein YceI [Myxococcota bacterium]|jgi:polyisoprenoid-binding protein YceI